MNLPSRTSFYQGRLKELQEKVRIGWEASKQGKVVDCSTTMVQIRANLGSSHANLEE